MERLMQYVWEHRLILPADMRSVDGERLEVIDTGLLNRDAGPDFFNAKVRVVLPTGTVTATMATALMIRSFSMWCATAIAAYSAATAR